MVSGSVSNYPKTLKNRPFLSVFFQLRPLSGQQRPDGWPDGFLISTMTFRNKFCFFPYIICLPTLSPIKVDRGYTDRHTDRHTHRHPYFIINIDQGYALARRNTFGVTLPLGRPRVFSFKCFVSMVLGCSSDILH